MTNLMLEVDEAMRWERIEKFWKAYGNYVITAILIIVIGTAVFEGWRAYQTHVRSVSSEKFLTLLQDEKFPENIKGAENEIGGPVEGVALVMAAGDYLKKDKPKEALELFERAIADSATSKEMRQLATLMRARLISSDAANKEDLVKTLEPIIRDKKSPWRAYALLESAALAANRSGDFEKARGYLKQIIEEENLPQSIYAKAHALDQIYTMRAEKTGAPKTTTKTEQGS